MNFPAGTTLEQKRAACRPEVFRYRYPSAAIALGHTTAGRDLRLPRARGLSRRPADVRERQRADRPRHERRLQRHGHAERLHRRQAERDAAALRRPRLELGAAVHDRRQGHRLRRRRGTAPTSRCPAGSRAARPSLEGVAPHRHDPPPGATRPAQIAPFDATEDIDFDHEAELSASGNFLIATDERGGGILPPGRHAARPGRESTTRWATAASTSTRPTRSTAAARDGRGRAGGLRADARGRQGDLPRRRSAPSRGRRSAPRTSSTRSRARTGSSWPGTRRART